MDFVTKIKDAITPHPDTLQPLEGSPMTAEDNMPGSFPEAADEQGNAAEEHNKSSSVHKQQDSGVGVGPYSATEGASLAEKQPALGTDAEKTERVGPAQSSEARDFGNDDSTRAQAPGTAVAGPAHIRGESAIQDRAEKGEVAPSSKLHSQTGSTPPNPLSHGTGSERIQDSGTDLPTTSAKPHYLGSEGQAGTFEAPNTASRGAQRKTDEVKPHHLGDEGKAENPYPATSTEWTTQEVKPHHLGNEGKLSGAGAQANIPSTTATQETHVPEAGSDPSLDAAHRQAQGTQGTFGIPVPPRQHDAPRGAGFEDPSLGAAAGQLQANALGAAYSSGGIHNGVLGAGSDDPQGLGAEGIHERHSHHKKGDSRSSLPKVSESGLGQGGIHNGVVGHGSMDENNKRRSTDGGFE